LGCLYAAKLAQAGMKVCLLDYRHSRIETLRQSGITVESGDDTFTVHPKIQAKAPLGLDFVLLLTKAHSTALVTYPPDTPILTLQNGLGNVETLCNLVGSARVMAGATTEASTLLDVGRIRHVSSGVTWVGAWTSCDPTPAIEALRGAGFQVEQTQAPGQMIWEKVAINAGINPLSALLNVPNGRLLELKEVRKLMRDLVVEAAKVAATEGYRFDRSLVENAEEICRVTSANFSSMLQDVRAGKRTEIDAISGEIVRRAQIASLPTPRTRVVWQLVKGLEGQ